MRLRHQLKTVYLLLALVICQTATAAEPVVIAENSSIFLAPALHVWIPDQPATFEQMLEADRRGAFTPPQSRTIPRLNQDIWYRFDVMAKEPFNNQLILNFQELIFNQLEVHYQYDGKWHDLRTGLELGGENRSIDYRFFALPLQLDPETPTRIYFRLSSFTRVFVTPLLETNQTFFSSAIKQSIISISIIGILAASIFYSWYLASALLRPKQQFAYLGLLSSSLLYIFFNDGYLSYLFKSYPDFSAQAYFLTIGLIYIFQILYCRYCLELRQYNKQLDQIATITLAIVITSMFYLLVFGTEQLTSIIAKTSIITFIVLWLATANAIKNGQQGARFYAAALAISSSVAIYNLMEIIGSVEYGPNSRNYTYFGALSLVFLLTLSLIRRLLSVKKQQLLLERKASEAEARDSSKELFLSSLSGEIRTPINSIIGMAQLLKESRLDSTQSDYVDVLLSSSKNLQNSINDFLDLSNVDENRLQLENVFFNLNQLAVYTITSVSQSNKSKPIKFDIDEVHPLPFYLKGDPTRLQKILKNLLSNALRISDRGSITLQIQQLQNSGNQTIIKFSIIDKSPSIADTDIADLALMATDTDSIVKESKGVNLSLAICFRLIRLMNGEIGLINNPGSGYELWFSIPLEIDIEHQQNLSKTVAKLAEKKLAIVFGNLLLSRSLTNYFNFNKISTEVMDYDTPLDAVDLSQFDILLLSNSLAEYTRTWINAALDHNIKILLFNNINNNVFNSAEIKSLNINTINPPYGTSQVLEVLDKVLTPRNKETERSNQKPGHTNNSTSINVMVAEDNSVTIKVMQAMLSDCDAQVDYVTDGVQAVALYQQSNGNYDLILMDCDMPEMDGYEATQRIRDYESQHSAAKAMIVALTAHNSEDIKILCMQAGMNGVIFKPVQKSMLMELLSSVRDQP